MNKYEPMKVFQRREVRAALEYAAAGGQALHLDQCGTCAHLLDQDALRLIETAWCFGVKTVKIHHPASPKQHVDLWGTPLRNAKTYAAPRFLRTPYGWEREKLRILSEGAQIQVWIRFTGRWKKRRSAMIVLRGGRLAGRIMMHTVDGWLSEGIVSIVDTAVAIPAQGCICPANLVYEITDRGREFMGGERE